MRARTPGIVRNRCYRACPHARGARRGRPLALVGFHARFGITPPARSVARLARRDYAGRAGRERTCAAADAAGLAPSESLLPRTRAALAATVRLRAWECRARYGPPSFSSQLSSAPAAIHRGRPLVLVADASNITARVAARISRNLRPRFGRRAVPGSGKARLRVGDRTIRIVAVAPGTLDALRFWLGEKRLRLPPIGLNLTMCARQEEHTGITQGRYKRTSTCSCSPGVNTPLRTRAE